MFVCALLMCINIFFLCFIGVCLCSFIVLSCALLMCINISFLCSISVCSCPFIVLCWCSMMPSCCALLVLVNAFYYVLLVLIGVSLLMLFRFLDYYLPPTFFSGGVQM